MKITNSNMELLVFNDKFKEAVTKNFPADISWSFANLFEVLNDKVKIFIDKKKEFFNEYAEKDDDGKFILEDNKIVLKKDIPQHAIDDLNAMAALEIDIGLEKIDIDLEEILRRDKEGILHIDASEWILLKPFVNVNKKKENKDVD